MPERQCFRFHPEKDGPDKNPDSQWRSSPFCPPCLPVLLKEALVTGNVAVVGLGHWGYTVKIHTKYTYGQVVLWWSGEALVGDYPPVLQSHRDSEMQCVPYGCLYSQSVEVCSTHMSVTLGPGVSPCCVGHPASVRCGCVGL